MKSTWNNPEIVDLEVEMTQRGPNPQDSWDEGIYDNDGNWWGGGRS